MVLVLVVMVLLLDAAIAFMAVTAVAVRVCSLGANSRIDTRLT